LKDSELIVHTKNNGEISEAGSGKAPMIVEADHENPQKGFY